MPQINLHQHSDGSLLDGSVTVRGIAQHAKDIGAEAISVTDHNECNQHLAFQKVCREMDLHPIFGMEGDWVSGPEYISQIREKAEYPHARSHICLLAENNTGLSNLWALSTLAYTDKYRYKKPLLIPDLLEQYKEGIYASDGCFAGSEKFLTESGTKTFADTVGTTQRVLGSDGYWTEGEIRSFGIQELYRITLSRHGVDKEIMTTANHRWLRSGYRWPCKAKRVVSDEVLTDSLAPGDTLRTKFTHPCTQRTSLSSVGIQAGIVFGDGTVDVSGSGRRSARVKLYGRKEAQLLKWFPMCPTTACVTEDAIEVRGLPGYFKDAPSLSDSSFGYLYGWLAGYFAADGCVTAGKSAQLSSASRDNLQLARDVCHILGIRTGTIRESIRARIVLPQGSVINDHAIYNMTISIHDLVPEFFLIEGHRIRAQQVIKTTKSRHISDWTVKSVEPTGKCQEVFCAVVPKGNAFVLDDNILTGNCLITEFARGIYHSDEDRAAKAYTTLLDIYGDHFYTELHTWQYLQADDTPIKFFGEMITTAQANQMMTDVNQAKLRYANRYGVPVVIVNDAHYARKEDWLRKEYVWKFSTGKKAKGDDQDVEEPQLQKADWLMAEAELYEYMALHGISSDVVAEGVKNANQIAFSCHAEISRTLDMPRLSSSEEEDFIALVAKVEKGFRDKVTRAGLDEELYHHRVQTELSLIRDKGFAGYFMVEDDLIEATVSGRWVPSGSNKPLLVGPGRGSAGGCLITYLLGITSLDPIHYDLLFERFLSPGRKDYPDIDVDFPQSYRQGIKGYVEHRHGEDCVCTIGTLGKSGPKQMLKDLGRALMIDGADVDKMSRIIEQVKTVEKEVIEGEEDEGPSWAEVFEQKGGELKYWANKHPKLFDNINDMRGIIRNASKHASGVVVSNKPLLGNIPLRLRNDQLVTQLDMFEVEELGAVKLDLLGLRHLDTLMHARNLIYERHGVWLDYRVDRLSEQLRNAYVRPPGGQAKEVIEFDYDRLADPDIWGEVAKGNTLGFFQIESAELSRLSQQLQPKNEKDVAALISIVRPGVKDAKLDRVYLARRNGLEDVAYDHPMMEPITKDTYGVMIYQEQLLRAVQYLAGFTPGEADDLRKALGKKKMDKVLSFKEKFRDGCLANEEFMATFPSAAKAKPVIEKIWASIEASGRYAFNKSHAVGYAIISTWEVWTKHYYPLEYLTALLATDGKGINLYVREARRLGIRILPPDVNVSNMHFTPGPVGSNEIRYGLAAIKGIAGECVREILGRRGFLSVDDLVSRCNGKKVSKSKVESLISIGALDSFEYDPEIDGDRQQLCRTRLFTQYHDCRILSKAALSVQAKLAKDPEARAAHIAAWRERNGEKDSYKEEFAIPDFADDHTLYGIEQELVGNYILMDPLADYIEYLENKPVVSEPADYDNFEPKAEFYVGGLLTRVKPVTVKKKGQNFGKEMAFIEIQWNEMDFDVTVFPNKWATTQNLLVEGYPVCCRVLRDNLSCNLLQVERLDMTR